MFTVGFVSFRITLVKEYFRKQINKRREEYSTEPNNVTTNASKHISEDYTFICNLSDKHQKLVDIVSKLSKSNALQVYLNK